MKPKFLGRDQTKEIYANRIAQLEGLHLNAKINRRIEETFEHAEMWEVEKGEALIATLQEEMEETLKSMGEGNGQNV